jgi:VWFA-related protein
MALFTTAAFAQQSEPPVRITLKPSGLVHGMLSVPVTVSPETARIVMTINGAPFAEQKGRSVVFNVRVGKFLRRLRIHVTGYDASGVITGEDEVVINDPQPPFRVKLVARDIAPEDKSSQLSAIVTTPPGMSVSGVDFFYGETNVGTDVTPPYQVNFDPSTVTPASYVRVAARGGNGSEANDVYFFGASARESVDVILQRVPVSIVGRHDVALSPQNLVVTDNGQPLRIEAVQRADDQPLKIILLMDASESMLEELPLLKQAAKEFARKVLRPGDQLAVVGFHQRTFWLTPFTSDLKQIDSAVDRLKTKGQTHLYDAAIEMLYELQKEEGRKALIVLTDGANQGGNFELDHLVHYAKYSGIPLYPVIKNTMLSRLKKVGVGFVHLRRIMNVARDTGATYFIIERNSELPKVYGAIADELRKQYVLMFYPERVEADQWHALAVTSTTGAQLRAPKGYFP